MTTPTTTIDRAEIEIVIDMLTTRADQNETAARTSKGYAQKSHFAEARAYREAASILRDTLRGVSWVAIRQQQQINRAAIEEREKRIKAMSAD